MYQPIDSGPWLVPDALRRAPMSSSAVVPAHALELAGGLALERVETRSGSFWTSVIAIPLGHA